MKCLNIWNGGPGAQPRSCNKEIEEISGRLTKATCFSSEQYLVRILCGGSVRVTDDKDQNLSGDLAQSLRK